MKHERTIHKDLRGMSRLVALLLILLGVMIVLISIPVYLSYRDQAGRIGCHTALDTAQRQLTVDYLMVNGTPTAKDAKNLVTYAMNGWDDLCPAGGTVYIVENKDPNKTPYTVVCGLHDTDLKERTRLNASYVLQQVEQEVRAARLLDTPFPETVTVKLHHEDLTAVLVDADPGLKRGTGTTPGVEDTVIYYGLVGHSDFGAEVDLPEGSVWFFSYADEDYCANWAYGYGWSGDSYS